MIEGKKVAFLVHGTLYGRSFEMGEMNKELLAVCSLNNVEVEIPKEYNFDNPFLEIQLPSNEVACSIMSRLILCRSIYELWGQGNSLSSLIQSMKTSNYVNPCASPDTSFRMDIEAYNKTQILGVEELNFQAKVDLKNPTHKFSLLEFYGYDHNNVTDTPEYMYFGRWFLFAANTSMDPALSLVMANMGHAKENSFVFDPFVGSGSVLVGCAHHGSYVAGTDIDVNLMHSVGKASRMGQKWRFKDETIRNNLRQYGLEKHYIDAFVADFTRYNLWRSDVPIFDAIITDPPYGVREPAQKQSKRTTYDSREENFARQQAAGSSSHSLSNMLLDLVNFAARTLTVGSRLVFWMPIVREIYTPDNIPCHPCFKLISNSEQIFFARVSRRLITLEKFKSFDKTMESAYFKVDHYSGSVFREVFFTPDSEPSEKKRRDSK